jgi:hypothetical protein
VSIWDEVVVGLTSVLKFVFAPFVTEIHPPEQVPVAMP